MKQTILAFIAVLLCTLITHADDSAKYRAFADTVRSEVFATDLPSFAVKDIPSKYAGESAVIKSVYESVEARKKTGMGVGVGIMGLPMVSRRARVEFGHLLRMLIHINDMAALEKYSEFDFDTDHRERSYKSYEKSRHTMGVRLIKPDGHIVDIDTSEFIDVVEGKDGNKKSRKLAVPGLEIGDDIDLFFFTETKLQNAHPDPVVFKLRESAPILNYQIKCVIDDNLTTQYRTLNDAPDFNVDRDEDNNYVLTLELNDIDSHEPRLWYNSKQQTPQIALHIYNRRNTETTTPKSAKKDGLQRNPDADVIISDRWDKDDNWIEKGAGYHPAIFGAYRDERKIVKTLAKQIKKGTITQRQAADYIYNYLVYAFLGNRYNLKCYDFAQIYQSFAMALNINVDMALSSTDRYEPLDQLIDFSNNIYVFRLADDSTRYYIPPFGNPFIIAPGDINPAIQGRKATMWKKKKLRKHNREEFFEMPDCPLDVNRNLTEVEASIGESMSLDIHRNETYGGATKQSAAHLISWEDIDRGYTSWLNRHGVCPQIKIGKKEAADREAKYPDQRKEQLEMFKDEIREYHGDAAAKFTDGHVTDIGIDPDNPLLCYTLEYTLDNCIKKAGRNLIVSIGRLLNSQIEPLTSDRERTDDVYFRTRREYITKIALSVPDGYRVDRNSLALLNRNVSAPGGDFTVESGIKDDKVTITITKRYKEPRLAAEHWTDMLKVIDAAAAWNSATLVLEKK